MWWNRVHSPTPANTYSGQPGCCCKFSLLLLLCNCSCNLTFVSNTYYSDHQSRKLFLADLVRFKFHDVVNPSSRKNALFWILSIGWLCASHIFSIVNPWIPISTFFVTYYSGTANLAILSLNGVIMIYQTFKKICDSMPLEHRQLCTLTRILQYSISQVGQLEFLNSSTTLANLPATLQ